MVRSGHCWPLRNPVYRHEEESGCTLVEIRLREINHWSTRQFSAWWDQQWIQPSSLLFICQLWTRPLFCNHVFFHMRHHLLLSATEMSRMNLFVESSDVKIIIMHCTTFSSSQAIPLLSFCLYTHVITGLHSDALLSSTLLIVTALSLDESSILLSCYWHAMLAWIHQHLNPLSIIASPTIDII